MNTIVVSTDESYTNVSVDDIKSIDKQVKIISLNDLSFDNLNFLQFFPNLEILHSAGAKIKNFSGLKFCQKLVYLEIDGNKIKDFSVFKNLTSLRTLMCSGCEIKHLDFLSSLQNLEKLVCDYNKIISTIY